MHVKATTIHTSIPESTGLPGGDISASDSDSPFFFFFLLFKNVAGGLQQIKKKKTINKSRVHES